MVVYVFSNWESVLAGSTLSASEKAGFRVTIRWYLGYLGRQRKAVTIESAVHFLEHEAERRARNDWMREQWKAALRWFIRNAPVKKQWCEEHHLRKVSEAVARRSTAEAASLKGRGGGLTSALDWESALERLRARSRREGKSYRTEVAYLGWAKRWRRFLEETLDGGVASWEEALHAFLDDLAVNRGVVVATQRQALNALVYFCRFGIGHEVDAIGNFERARVAKRQRVALTQAEIGRLLAALPADWQLLARLQYGAGMRVKELFHLRVQDLQFAEGRIVVRQGKGNKDRFVALPKSLVSSLRAQLARSRCVFEQDRCEGAPGVYLAAGLGRKLPKAGEEWRWFWVFPARSSSKDPRSGMVRRHHAMGQPYQRALKTTADRLGIAKRVTSHVLRHSFATHCLERRVDLRTLQEVMGHRSLETTQVYLHMVHRAGVALPSPLDGLEPLGRVAEAGCAP